MKKPSVIEKNDRYWNKTKKFDLNISDTKNLSGLEQNCLIYKRNKLLFYLQKKLSSVFERKCENEKFNVTTHHQGFSNHSTLCVGRFLPSHS